MAEIANKRICRAHPIHMVLAADDSASMAGRPAAEVTNGIRTWLTELQALSGGGVKSYFRFSFIVFGSHAQVVVHATDLNDIDPEAISIDGKRGSTNMTAALGLAQQALITDGSTASFCPPFVFVYTDGQPDDGTSALQAAYSLRQLDLPCGRPTIVTLGFGNSNDSFLQRVASFPELYKKTRDASELAMLLPAIGTPTARVGGQTVEEFRDRIARTQAGGRILEI